MIKYFGPYHSIQSAYKALQTCIKNRELIVTGPPWEEYVSNPNLESDSAKWQTNIYYPVK
jgi:effector-binding domain-containing protein